MRETTLLSNPLGKHWRVERDVLNNFFELYEVFKPDFLEWLRTYFNNGGRILIDLS